MAREILLSKKTEQGLRLDPVSYTHLDVYKRQALRRLDWQQEQGFVSSLALGYNEVEIQRGMTTSSTAIFIPFMTRELDVYKRQG